MTALKRTSKLIKADVRKYGLSSIAKAKGAIEDSILCGLALIELKEETEFGQWENEFKSAIHGVFGMRHGQKLMQIAEQKELIKIAGNQDILSINDALKLISEATPEQQAKAEQLKIEEELKRQQAEAEKQRKAEEQTKKQAPTKEPEIIEGEFTEVKQEPKKEEVIPEPIPEENPIDLLQETIAELHDANGELLKEIESVTRVLDSNDQTGKALAEAKRYREENRVLKERINGLQSECNEAKRAAKYWKGKFEKLEKEFARDAA